ncbi:MAG: DUF4846 domain-containing protein [Flavipsychrobacter sp.]
MKRILAPFILCLLLAGCASETSSQQIPNKEASKYTIENQSAITLIDRFNAPYGYERAKVRGFGEYTRKLPMQQHGAKVHLYNGELKNTQNVHASVIKMDVGDKDLQQCADAVIRLRAEYLYHIGQYDKIHFNFTNGFKADYSKWRQGYRINVAGNKVTWVKGAREDNSYESFKNYLQKVFTYAGTLSLSKELLSVPFEEMEIGDVLIHGGSPGHAVIVVDMAYDMEGDKVFMLAQSYMPAQEIHVLKNLNDESISPWYSMKKIKTLVETPEWTFAKDELKRFK